MLLELPILYYPKLLNIVLNGKTVPYQSVLYLDHLITSVAPVSGEMNTITIQFRGLVWANRISLFSWCLWGILLVLLIVLRAKMVFITEKT